MKPLIWCIFALISLSALSALSISDEDRKMMVEIARAVKRVKRNPFKRDESTSRSSVDSDLREKETDNGDNDNTDDEQPRGKLDYHEGGRAGYCTQYEQHFSFYCVGEVDQSEPKVAYVVKQFCPSYKRACPTKTITSSSSLTSWPTDPFEKPITVTSGPVVEQRRESTKRRRHSSESDSDSAEDEEIYYAELRKRYPCKPDCDRRIFAHCTEECKCDYIYPIVQRFCNPPPMPLFLNTCRLWYHGCPKYERYHYSSQFVYSKAEKGKVLPGAPEQNPINPYNLPSPVPLRNRAIALAPIRHKREAENEEDLELIIPPPVPTHATKKVVKMNVDREEVALSAPQSRAILRNYQENMEDEEKEKRRRRRKEKKDRRRRRRRYRQRYEEEDMVRTTTKRPPTPKEVWRALKQLNSLTSGAGAIGLKSSPATLKGGNEQQGGLDGLLASVAQHQQQQNDVGRQWAAVAQDPREFTKEIVNAASDKKEEKVTNEQDEQFSKIRPRTLSSGVNPQVAETEETTEAETTGPKTKKTGKAKAFQGSIPVLPSDAAFAAAGGGDDTFRAFDGLSDSRGLVHTPRSRSPFTKPGLWEPNPADPHSRDPANKYWYHPESVGVDWLNGQLQWGGHWAVPAAGAGGTAGMSAVHFPTIGSFLNIPDDYD